MTSKTKWVDAAAVQAKGVQFDHAVKEVAKMIEASGYSELIVKSDGESSIVALKRAAVSELRRQGHAIQVQFEEAPKGDSQRNGVVERAIWEVEAQVRVLMHHAAEMHSMSFTTAHPLAVWAPTYAGQLLSRFQRARHDGRTAYERRRGKPYRRRLPAFGELVMFMTVAEGKKRAPQDGGAVQAWRLLRLVDRSDEVKVISPEGAFKVSVIRRLPPEQRGDKLFMEKCRGLPWGSPGAEGAGEVEGVVPYLAAAPVVPDAELPPALPAKPRDGGPRRVYIRREVELRPVAEGGFGLTAGCRGCDAVQMGTAATAHSEDCRRRIEHAMLQQTQAAERVMAAKKEEARGGRPRGGRSARDAGPPTDADSAEEAGCRHDR